MESVLVRDLLTNLSRDLSITRKCLTFLAMMTWLTISSLKVQATLQKVKLTTCLSPKLSCLKTFKIKRKTLTSL